MTGLDGGDAVSEVLSTILMVVVVILLAAIVGSLVFGIWPPMEPSITMATATRSGENVTFMVHGGTDVERVTNITCWIGGPGAGGEGVPLEAKVGYFETRRLPEPTRIVIVGTYPDGNSMVLFDEVV